jgi:hypothetical protein
MSLSDRKAGATNYPLNKILKIRFALVVCFISIFSLNNSDNLKGRAKKIREFITDLKPKYKFPRELIDDLQKEIYETILDSLSSSQ